MGKIKLIAALLPFFLSQQAHTLTFEETKDVLEKNFRIKEPKNIQFEGKQFTVYPLKDKNPQMDDPKKICFSEPFLVLDGNEIVTDPETYKAVSFLIRCEELELIDNFYRTNQKDIERYKGIVNSAFLTEIVFNITDLAIEIETNYLMKKIQIKKIPVKKSKFSKFIYLPEFDFTLNKFFHYIEKVLLNKKIALEDVNSSQTFREAMYDIISDSAKQLEELNKKIDKIRKGQPNYTEIKEIIENTLSSKLAAEAAIAALTQYYSDNTFRSAFNFAIEHVVKPMIDTEIIIDAAGTILPPIKEQLERAFEPYISAFEQFYNLLEAQKPTWQYSVGEECAEIGTKRMLSILNDIKRKIEKEKEEITYKKVIERYLNQNLNQNQKNIPKKFERSYNVINNDLFQKNIEELERVREEVARQNQDTLLQLEQNLQESTERSDWHARQEDLSRLYVKIKSDRNYVNVDIDNFLETLKLPVQIAYTVNKKSCVNIKVSIDFVDYDPRFLNLFFGEEIMGRIFWSESMRNDCVDAGTYILYPKEIDCPYSNCFSEIRKTIKDYFEYQKKTGMPFKPFTLKITYQINAQSGSQRANDIATISIEFYK
jgi:uncharacterized membrane protein YheB (UPF0754 family)